MVWTYIGEDEVARLIMGFVAERPEFIQEKTRKMRFWKDVTDNLRYRLVTVMTPLPGVMTQACFFNLETMKPELPSPDQDGFNYIDEPFDLCRPIDQKIANFVRSVCNYNSLQITVLKHYVKCLLLNRNSPHMILFLIGPGHTGKSTLAQMLISLKENTCCTWNLPNLPDRFGIEGPRIPDWGCVNRLYRISLKR